jgi:hypothetical protein
MKHAPFSLAKQIYVRNPNLHRPGESGEGCSPLSVKLAGRDWDLISGSIRHWNCGLRMLFINRRNDLAPRIKARFEECFPSGISTVIPNLLQSDPNI